MPRDQRTTYCFPKSARLRSQSQFDRVFDGRCSSADRRIIVYACRACHEENAPPGPRLGLTVSRKCGNAVVRNRWKRTLREAFRLVQHDLPPGIDFVVLPRPRPRPRLPSCKHRSNSSAGSSSANYGQQPGPLEARKQVAKEGNREQAAVANLRPSTWPDIDSPGTWIPAPGKPLVGSSMPIPAHLQCLLYCLGEKAWRPARDRKGPAAHHSLPPIPSGRLGSTLTRISHTHLLRDDQSPCLAASACAIRPGTYRQYASGQIAGLPCQASTYHHSPRCV